MKNGDLMFKLYSEEYEQELGGKHYAEQLLVAWINETGNASTLTASRFTGLPLAMTYYLLADLEKQGAIERQERR